MFPIATSIPDDVLSIMPDWETCRHMRTARHDTKWERLVSDWIFRGLKSLDLTARDGVDKKAAMLHLRIVMVSWGSKHEHKEAALAYLLDEWFTDGTWVPEEWPR